MVEAMSPLTLLYLLHQMKLNCIDAKVFPLPHNATASQANGESATAQPEATSRLAASNLLKYNLRPAARVDTVESVQQALCLSEVQAELRAGQQHLPCTGLSALYLSHVS